MKAVANHHCLFSYAKLQLKEEIEFEEKIVSLMNGLHYRQDAYLLIFWSMMILVLDKTDLEKHLSMHS